MLLGVVGAWAAVTQPETGVYVISGDENGRRGNLAACTGIPNFPALSNINWPGTTYGNNSVAAITNGEHWYVLKVYNRYVIYNLGLNKYLVKEGNNINFGDTPYLWQILVNGNYNSIYDEVGTYISFACGTKPSSTTRNVKFNNSSTDGGSLHTFTVVADGEQTYANQIGEVTKNAPIELSYELTDEFGNVYTGMYAGFAGTDLPTLTGLTFTSTRWENNKLFADITFPFPVSNAETTKKMMINGYTSSSQNFKWYAKDNTHIKVNEGSAPTIENVNNYLWAIYPSFNDGVFTYAIKNVATGKYITSSATTGAHADNTLGFSDTGISFTLVKDSWGYAFKIADKKLYLSINTSTDGTGEQPLGLHGNTHDGTSLSFIPYVVNYTITDEANNTYTGEGEGWAGLQIEPVFTGAAGYSLTDKVWDGNTFAATITFPFPVSKEVVISSFKGTKDPGLRKYYVGTGDNEGNVMYGPSNPPTDNKDKWIIEPSCNNTAFTFKIKNVGTSKYITTSATTTTDAKDSVTVTDAGTAFTVDADNRFKLPTTKSDGSALYLSAGSSTSNDGYLGAWTWNGNNGVHNGNCNYIYEVELPYEITDIAGNIFRGTVNALVGNAKEKAPEIAAGPGYTLSAFTFDGMKLNATVTFNIPVSGTEVTNPTLIINGASWDNTNSRKWRAVEDDGKLYVKVQRAEINYTDNNALWAIYPELNGNTFKFKIKSLSTGKFVKANPDCPGELNTDVTGNTKPVTLENEGTAFEYKVRTGSNCHFTYKNTSEKEVKLSMNSKNNDFDVFLGVYKDDHSGNDVAFPSYVENMNWPEFVSTGTTLNPLVIAIGNDVKKTLVAKKLPSSADRYVHVTASNEEPELGYGQWTIYPAFSGNKIGFKIKNIATDTYIYAKPNGASEVYPVVLNAEGTAFDFADSKFAYTDGANTLYLSVPTNESFDLPLGVGTEADETLKTITFHEFSSYQITIGTTGYTTVYSPFTAYTGSEDLEIYTITSAPQDGRVNLNLITSPQADDVSNYILENQGVIIKGNSGTYTFYITDDQEYFKADAWTDNKLSGSFTNTYVQGDAYVLSAPEGVESVGLYKALLNKDANGEDGTTHFKNNAGKAYLPASALSAEAAKSRFFVFDFSGEETGITETENGNVETENSEVYDLSGRRVQNAKKGIFVINGKVVVK